MNEKVLVKLGFDKIKNILAGKTTSDLGKELITELVPAVHLSIVNGLLKETTDGVNFIVKKGTPPMGGVHDIRESIKRIRLGAVLNPAELLKISDVLGVSRSLKSYASDDRTLDHNNIVIDMISCLYSNKGLEEKIRYAIVNEEEIADNASGNLFSIRRQMRNLQNSIKDKLNNYLRSNKYQKYMQESIVTMRGDRYVIPVKQEFRSDFPGLIHDASASGATLFIEPIAIVEANNEIKQYKIKEQAEIEKILLELTSDVLKIIDFLSSDVSILAKLDFILAKARFSLDFNCSCPIVNDQKLIILKRARHPLIDAKSAVPIDFWIGDDFNTLIITGPNTGGKTVTLKTVGLFSIMAQSGLHLPTNDGTQVCIFKDIFADIGDEQSIEQNLSTFSSHMTNIVNILHSVDELSLVLFDELGAGTDPSEGAVLAMAILDYLNKLKVLTVATTHYSDLKFYAISTDGVENACCEFNVDTLKPTYKLLIGVPGKSNALAISKRLGLEEAIIDKAKEFLNQEDIRFEDMLYTIEKNLNQTKEEKIKAEGMKLDIQRIKEDLEEQKRKIDLERHKILKDAKEEAKRIFLGAKQEADEIILSLKKLEKQQKFCDKNKEVHEVRQNVVTKVSEINQSLHEPLMPKVLAQKILKDLKPGDNVLIINLNQRGTIINPPDKNGEALVQVGIMKVNIHVSNLKRVNEEKAELQKSGAFRIGIAKTKNISCELDIRGSNLDDAVELVDKYIDDVAISSIREVTIIHGKGTGILRAGIHSFLKTNSHVKSFRLGKYGEGDTGVTIIELV